MVVDKGDRKKKEKNDKKDMQLNIKSGVGGFAL